MGVVLGIGLPGAWTKTAASESLGALRLCFGLQK